jgi:Fic family protein
MGMSQCALFGDMSVASNPESLEAGQSIDKSAVRDLIEKFIRERGTKGATCDEIEAKLKMRHQTVSARITEMKRSGVLIKLGTRNTRSGRKAAVLSLSNLQSGEQKIA